MQITFFDLEYALNKLVDSDKLKKAHVIAHKVLKAIIEELKKQSTSTYLTYGEIFLFVSAMSKVKILDFEPLKELIGINLIDCICSFEEIGKSLTHNNNHPANLEAYFGFFNACRYGRVPLTTERCKAFLELSKGNKDSVMGSISMLRAIDDISGKLIDLVLKFPLIMQSLLIRLDLHNNPALARKVFSYILEAPNEEESAKRLALMRDCRDNGFRRAHIQDVSKEKLTALAEKNSFFRLLDATTLKKYSRFERLHNAIDTLQEANVDAENIKLFLTIHADNYYIDSYIEALAACIKKHGINMCKSINLFLKHPNLEQCMKLLVACSFAKDVPASLPFWLNKKEPLKGSHLHFPPRSTI